MADLAVIPPTEASVLVDASPSPRDRVVKRSSNVLGRGPVRPFRRDDKNDFANAEGEDLVRSCVGQILNMRGSTPTTQGELEWDPDRGSILFRLRHQKNDLIRQELARQYVIDALRRFEPRVVIKAVTCAAEELNGAEQILAIRLRYDVISTNVPGNQVILSDVQQTVLLPLAA